MQASEELAARAVEGTRHHQSCCLRRLQLLEDAVGQVLAETQDEHPTCKATCKPAITVDSTIIIMNYYKSLHRKEKVLHDREKGVIDPRYNLHRFRPLEPHPGGTYTMYTFRVIIKIGAQ